LARQLQLTLTEMGLSYQCGPLASPFFQAHAREETQTTAKILLAEDNPGDVFLVRRALAMHHIDSEMTVMGDGETALGFIEGADAGDVTWRPDVMLVDLNLPRAPGTSVLERLQKSPRLSKIPVVVVTSSGAASDRNAARRFGATEYFQKPIDLAGFMELGDVVRKLLDARQRFT